MAGYEMDKGKAVQPDHHVVREGSLPQLEISNRNVEVGARLVVKANPDDYLVVFRRDIAGSLRPLINGLMREGESSRRVEECLVEHVDPFIRRLAHCMRGGYAHHLNPTKSGRVSFEMLSDVQLRDSIRHSTQNSWVVSIDSLLELGAQQLQLSHVWTLDGWERFSVNRASCEAQGVLPDSSTVARPGTPPIREQIEGLRSHYQLHGEGREIVAQDDTLFSGTTMRSVLDVLRQAGIVPNRVIPTIQVGHSDAIERMGVVVDPIVKYCVDGADDVFKRVNMYGFGDFILGAAGLVVQLPTGRLGRAPYFYPFMAPSSQAAIDPNQNRLFSLEMLDANGHFFEGVQKALGRSILVKHLDPAYAALLDDVHEVDPNVTIDTVIDWARRDFDQIIERTSNIAVEQGSSGGR